MASKVKKPTVLITGANGFIGGRIVERLFLEDKANIRAGVHKFSGAARIGRFPVDIIRADVAEPSSLEDAVSGADVVIHTAYGDRRTTVEGTENVLKASLKAGVSRFIHFSTVEVYGDVSGEIDESAPLVGSSGDEYSVSKATAEGICLKYHSLGLPVVILRPAVVYGPFSKPWTIRLAERFSSGKWKMPSGINGLCTPVYIDDVVDVVFLSMRHRKAVGEAFNVGGPEILNWVEFFDHFNSSLSLPPLRREGSAGSYSKALAMAPVRISAKFALNNYPELTKKVLSATPWLKKFAKQSETTIKTSVSLEELSLYKRSAVYKTQKAEKLLSYKPRFDLASGLKLTSAWLKHQGYLPSEVEEFTL